jgi:hypothetical protein
LLSILFAANVHEKTIGFISDTFADISFKIKTFIHFNGWQYYFAVRIIERQSDKYDPIDERDIFLANTFHLKLLECKGSLLDSWLRIRSPFFFTGKKG